MSGQPENEPFFQLQPIIFLDQGREDKQLGFWALMREIYPTVL